MKKQQKRTLILGGILGIILAISAFLIWQSVAPRTMLDEMEDMMDGAAVRGMGMMGGGAEHGSSNTRFSESVDGLPDVVPSEVVVLKDGDTYEMTAGLVKQEVGNRVIRRLAYNRMIPGPRIQVEKDATITIVFKNALEIPTTLHSHGLRLDDDFDGLPTTMGGKQKEMQPGETFRYTLTFPDTGVYWYHPHVREDYTQEMGLYGNYHVTEDGYWADVDREAFLIVDDFSENDPFYTDVTNKTMMGRFGNILLINNQEDFRMTARTGERLRFFVTNTANTRTFDLAIAGQTLQIVGGDVGRGEREFMAEHFVIAPAERIIFETTFAQPGTYAITHRGTKIGEVVVTGDAVTIAPRALRDNSADYASVRNNITQYMAQAPDKRLRLTIGMKGMGAMSGMGGGMMGGAGNRANATQEMRRGMEHEDGSGTMMGGELDDLMDKERSLGGTPHNDDTDGIEWEDGMARMNAMSNSAMMEWMMIDEATGKTNTEMSADWTFIKGQMVKIEIYNDPASMHPMQHPIHFHGQRFVILSRDGKVNDNLQWKDTALVRTGERMTILVEMSNPGQWIAHCHIAEHMHAGMMFNFRVQ